MTSPIVAFDRASVAHGGRRLWHDLTLDVEAGEFVAVLGPNGSGKTTLLRAVLGLQPLTSGSVRIDGHAPRRGDQAIGYVPQQRLIDASTPVRGVDLLGFGVTGTRFGIPIPRAADRRRIAALTDTVGAASFAGRPAASLSGGEQQRLRIGQALADDPALLLCDEPLISLDLANQRGVSDLIDAHRRNRTAAVLFVTHDINPILPMVDRVLYLAEGGFRIGTPNEVLRSQVLSDLYGAHVDVLRVHDRVIVVGGPGGHAEHEHGGRP